MAENEKPVRYEIIHISDIIKNFVSNTKFDETVGNINSALDLINGEVV